MRKVEVYGAVVMLTLVLATARADTVASLLGNFTINQYCGVEVDRDAINVHFVIVFGQLPALRELHLADADQDGVTTAAERDAYFTGLAAGYADRLIVNVDGVAVPLHAERIGTSLPTEQSGFSLRVDARLVGTLPAARVASVHRVEFNNANFGGHIGWHEINVQSAGGINLFNSSAFVDSLTQGLSVSPKSLPIAGPLEERLVQFSYIDAALPAGAVPAKFRSGATVAASAPPADAPWLAVQTRRLLSLISSPSVSLPIKVLALLGAFLLGALHAFSPGHGKTVVGAYLIGSRGTPRHAAFLGLIVTITHTLGVFALGFATLFAANYIVPEKLFPIISLISGLLVVGIGGTLLVQRLRTAFVLAQPLQFMPVQPQPGARLAFAPHAHDHGLVHSHGGTPHSHLPPNAPGERITWRSLLALGVSGGLIPCPSAMVLLLAAVALNKTALGLLLVVAFSVGLAGTLTLVGLAFLYARRLFPRMHSGGRWARQLPIASAALITLVGIVICYGAIAGNGSAL